MQRRQRRLADELVKGKSPSQAAATIGLSRQRAQALAATPAVQTMVERGLARATKLAELSAAEVIRELGHIGLFDVGSMFDEHGRLRPVALWDEPIGHVVSSFDVLRSPDGPDEIVRIKFWSKIEALRTLADHLGLLRHLDVVPEKPVDMSVYTDEELRLLAALARKGVVGAQAALPRDDRAGAETA